MHSDKQVHSAAQQYLKAVVAHAKNMQTELYNLHRLVC